MVHAVFVAVVALFLHKEGGATMTFVVVIVLAAVVTSLRAGAVANALWGGGGRVG